MDEPTNDLDLETLELLEELLLDYSGTLLLVSHDRAFLDNVVTSTLVIEPDGRVKEYAGGYNEARRRREAESAAESRSPAKAEPPRASRDQPRKLSYKEQRELDALPRQIEILEAEQGELHRTMADPGFYQREGAAIAEATARLAALGRELADAYLRWEELEASGA